MSNGQLTYRIANAADHVTVVSMLSELVDELSPDDNADQIKQMLNEDIREAFETDQICIFLAELDNQPVGLSRGDILTNDPIFRLREDHRCGYVDQMFVRQGYRDRGIGQHLLRLCEDWFRQQGVEHAVLHAAPKAIRFYARIGYQPNREMFKKL
jgi:GNAT superfamily N-acetyltransferase